LRPVTEVEAVDPPDVLAMTGERILRIIEIDGRDGITRGDGQRG
jgi:hypothetical protein